MMDAKTMWEQYTAANPTNAQYDAWCFGDDADTLAKLVLDGTKTATASAYPFYELEGEKLPQEGEYSVLLWQDGSAACVIKTTKVYIAPFCEVSSEQAFREGEGDRSLAYWQSVHRKFFTKELENAGLTFSEDMEVVCEEFIRVYP